MFGYSDCYNKDGSDYMKTVYKGSIASLELITGVWRWGQYRPITKKWYFNDKIKQYKNELSYTELSAISHFFETTIEENDYLTGNVLKIFNKMFKGIYFEYDPYKLVDILYEKVVDENGISYARELHTNLCFPLFESNRCFEESKYFFKKEYENGGYNILIKKLCNLNLSTMDKCSVVVIDEKVADMNEVEDYKMKFGKTFFGKKKENSYREKIRKIYNMNVFNQEIVEKKTKERKPREKQSYITIVMDNIEFLLMKLNQCDKDLYNKYKAEYDDILNSESDVLTINPLTITNLTRLEANLELDLLSSKGEASSILEYLDNLRKEYLSNFLTKKERKTSLTIKELERINELFLKVKERYSYREQRFVLKSLAFIYLLELKENIDFISLDELESSYVNDHIKSILINIDALMRVGLIKSNLLVDLNQELSLANILEIIEELEFISLNNEDVSQYVKRIEF